MSRQVTFDYSKAGSFISEEEIGYNYAEVQKEVNKLLK